MIVVFWVVTLHSLIGGYNVSEKQYGSIFRLRTSTTYKEALCSFETLVTPTRLHDVKPKRQQSELSPPQKSQISPTIRVLVTSLAFVRLEKQRNECQKLVIHNVYSATTSNTMVRELKQYRVPTV
jgi:hypothetical protein